MDTHRAIASSVGIALVVIYAVGSGIWVSSGDIWYRSLRTPSWQPPDWVFGVMWPYNFIVLAIGSLLVGQRLAKSTSLFWLGFFAVTVILALLWAYQFYQAHNLRIATISLVFAALLTLPLLFIAQKISWWLLLALLPYQVWLFIAASLSWGYQQKN